MKKILKAVLFMLMLAMVLMAPGAVFAEGLQEQLMGDEDVSTDETMRVEGYSFVVNASSITYGMHLYDSVLDTSQCTIVLDGQTVKAESVGSFLWRNRMLVPEVGESSHSVYFVPNEDLGISFNDVQVTVQVNKARPVISQMPVASGIRYGQSLSQSRLTGGAAVNPHNGEMEPVQGVFEWEIRDLVPSVGSQHATVVFTPIINAADRYETVYFSVPVEVEKLLTVLQSNPVPSRTLLYGETLSALTLTGGAAVDEYGQSVSGNCVFEEDRILPVGTHTVNAVFMPLDHAHRESVPFSVEVTVEKAPLEVTAQPVEITYGQALAEGAILGTATDLQGNAVAGSFAFAEGARKPAVRESGMFDAVFTPENQDNYSETSCGVQVTVHKKQLLLQWSDNMKYAGMQDGAYRYLVPGLPENAALLGDVYRDAGENVGTYTLYGDRLSLPADLAENYVLIKENGVFRIEQIDFSESAFVSGEVNENGWYAAAAQLNAPAGYAVSFTRGGEYARQLVLPESASGTEYYLRAEQGEYTGAVAGPFRADYRLDTTPPDIVFSVLDGNEFILTASDAGSGVDRIYGLFAGPVREYAGAADAAYAYAARETGDYTYVVHDMAGHTAAVTVDFPDTDQDGLVDAYELRTGTAVDAADTDMDGIGDLDSRRIRNILGYERLQVSGAALLGVVADEGVRDVHLPEETVGLLVRDERFVLRPMASTFRGVMRVNDGGTYGFAGDLMWYLDRQGAYSALHTEELSGKFALSAHAPGGLMALANYDGTKTLSDIFLADMTNGKMLVLTGTAGTERFDLSPDGKQLAYLKNGIASLVDVETGSLLMQAPVETVYVFQFDEQGRLVTDNGCFVPDGEGWEKADNLAEGSVLYVGQSVRGESCLWIYDGEDAQYLLRSQGSAALENGETVRTLRAVLVKMEASRTPEEQIEAWLNMPLNDEVTIGTELFTKPE